MNSVLGIDVGGTKIAAGLVEMPGGYLTRQETIPTGADRGGAAVLNDVAKLAEDLAGDVSVSGNGIQAVGIGLCELVAPNGSVLSANCISWQNQPVLERLSAIAPVFIEADVRAAALAEAMFGAGRTFRIFLYVTVGTGISSCLVIEGEPFLGARGATGTMASSPLAWRCAACGQTGANTLEDLASGPGMAARFNQQHSGKLMSAEEVLAAARAGNAAALDVVHTAGSALGVGIGMLINVLDPEAIIIGGGLGLSVGPYWDSLVETTRKSVWSDLHRTLPILRAETGQTAGVIGAAAAAWKKVQTKIRE